MEKKKRKEVKEKKMVLFKQVMSIGDCKGAKSGRRSPLLSAHLDFVNKSAIHLKQCPKKKD